MSTVPTSITRKTIHSIMKMENLPNSSTSMGYPKRDPNDPFDMLACLVETIWTPKIRLYFFLGLFGIPFTHGTSFTVVLPFVLLTFGVADIIKQWQKNH